MNIGSTYSLKISTTDGNTPSVSATKDFTYQGESYITVPPPCADADGDGYNVTGGDCGPIDCNDADNSTNPGASDICDITGTPVDKNCDNITTLNCHDFCGDMDRDGYVTNATRQNWTWIQQFVCPWLTQEGNDCNDGNANIHPNAPELCNGIDDNCNNQTDEGCAAVDKQTVMRTLSPLKPVESDAINKLNDAKKEINLSLGNLNPLGDKDIVWIDTGNLACKHGDKVFDHEKKAVDNLLKVNSTTKNATVKQAAVQAANMLVQIDRNLAQKAITEAQQRLAQGNTTIKQHDIDKALENLNKGDAATKLTDKIEHYRKAWKYVHKHCLTEPTTCIESITLKSPKGELVSATGDEVSSLSTGETLFNDTINNVQLKLQTSCSKCLKVNQSFSSWVIQEIVYKPGQESIMTARCR